MKKNIGFIDRVVRAIIGIAAIIGSFFATSATLQIVLLIVGAVALIQAVIGWCGLYALFGYNTCPIDAE